jgi:predicted HTH transcriptional regulator
MTKLIHVRRHDWDCTMNFPSDSELKSLHTFPCGESHVLEFKLVLPEKDVLLSSICALLNNGIEGHIVIGVHPTDYRIVGLPLVRSQLDAILLSIDGIVHNSMILCSDKTPMHPTSMIATVIDRDNHSLIVIRIMPEKGKTYMTASGQTWYRLSASNYKVKSEEFIVRSAVESIVDKRIAKLKQDVEDLKRLIK